MDELKCSCGKPAIFKSEWFNRALREVIETPLCDDCLERFAESVKALVLSVRGTHCAGADVTVSVKKL